MMTSLANTRYSDTAISSSMTPTRMRPKSFPSSAMAIRRFNCGFDFDAYLNWRCRMTQIPPSSPHPSGAAMRR